MQEEHGCAVGRRGRDAWGRDRLLSDASCCFCLGYLLRENGSDRGAFLSLWALRERAKPGRSSCTDLRRCIHIRRSREISTSEVGATCRVACTSSGWQKSGLERGRLRRGRGEMVGSCLGKGLLPQVVAR